MEFHIKYNLTDYYIGLIELDLNDKNELANMKKRGAVEIDFGEKHKNVIPVLTLFRTEKFFLRCLHNMKQYNYNVITDLSLIKNVLPAFGIEIDDKINDVEINNLFKYLFNLDCKDSFEQLYQPYDYYLEQFYVGTLSFCKSYYDDFRTRKLEKNYINVPQYCLLTKSSAKIIDTDSFYRDDNYIYNYLFYRCLFLKSGNGYLNLNDNKIYIDNIRKINFFEIDNTFSNFLKDNSCNYDDESITMKKALTLFKKYNK